MSEGRVDVAVSVYDRASPVLEALQYQASQVRVRALLRQVEFQDWHFLLISDSQAFLLQVEFWAPDRDTGERALQRGRKWRISMHATDSEVIQTAFLAVLTAVEHEAREQFTYKGVAVFGPHIDTEALVKAAQREDRRPEPSRRLLRPVCEGCRRPITDVQQKAISGPQDAPLLKCTGCGADPMWLAMPRDWE